MRVFVTDGDQRATLAVTRSLGRRGIDVLVGEECSRSLSSSSRYCTSSVAYPSPYRYLEEFCHFLIEFLQKTHVDVLLPITDVTTYLIALHRGELERYVRLPIPQFETFDFVSDKWALLKHAKEIGIPIPETHFIEGIESLPGILGQLQYPIVVKAG